MASDQTVAAPIADPTPAPALHKPVTQPAADEPEKKNRRLGCIALVVIAIVVFAIIGSLGRDPDETATSSPTPDPTTEATAASPSPTVDAATPTAIPSPIATLEQEPAFATIELTGTGNAVPRFEIPEGSAAIADLTHSGGANFAVWTVDAGGAQTDLLVNTIGNHTGTVLFDEAAGSHSVAFDIEADGPWTIVIKPVTEAFEWNGTQELSGSGDDVAILNPPSSGLKSVTLTHQGDSNFAIWAYGPSTDLIVNEIGEYSGEVLINDGTFLFEITANGPWTIGPPQ